MNVNGEVSLTGRKVKEIVVFNALVITSTSTTFSSTQGSTPDVSDFRDWVLMARSTLDQAVNLTFNISGKGPVSSDATTTVINIPANQSYKVYSAKTLDIIGKAIPTNYKFDLGASATVAPTTGTLTVVIWGVPN